MKKILVVLALLPMLGLAACAKKEEPPPPPPPAASASGPAAAPSLPPSHEASGAPAGLPPGTDQPVMPAVPRQVVVPDDVQKTWKGVVLQVTDKSTNKSQDLKIDIGKTAKVGNLEITVEHFLPDFNMSGGSITSKSNETQNPAARLVIKKDGKEVYSGWRFSLYPQAHPMNLEKYDILLKDFVKKS
jgi:hypothetical protein